MCSSIARTENVQITSLKSFVLCDGAGQIHLKCTEPIPRVLQEFFLLPQLLRIVVAIGWGSLLSSGGVPHSGCNEALPWNLFRTSAYYYRLH